MALGVLHSDHLTSQASARVSYSVRVRGQTFSASQRYWKTSSKGMQRLVDREPHRSAGNDASLRAIPRRLSVFDRSQRLDDTIGSFAEPQTSSTSFRQQRRSSQRCMLMTTDPGDLVLDPDLRQRHDGLRRRAVGPPLDHDRHQPRAARARPPAAADRDLPLLRAEGRRARPGRRLRLQAQAEQQGRGGRRHRPARHAQEHRQRRAAGRGSARRSARGRQQDHARHRAVRRRGDDPDAGRLGRRRQSRTPAPRRRRLRLVRRADARGAAPIARAAPRRRQDRRRSSNVRPPAKSLSLSAEGAAARTATTQAGRVRLRPGERRDQREAGPRGAAARRSCKSYTHLLRHRLRHPAATRGSSIDKSAEPWASCRRPTSRRRPT